MGDPSDLAATAYEYGPFLFAILFVTGLTVVAQRAYARAEKPEQVKTFRIYFYTSFFFGLALVAVCVVAWINERELPHQYVYTFDIQNVPPQVSFMSTDACIRSEPVVGIPLETVHAVFVEKSRLLPGAPLRIMETPVGGTGAPDPAQFKRVVLNVMEANTMLDYHDLKPQ